MDWNRPGKLIHPNPNWEEDLLQTVVVGPIEEARLKSYVEDALKKKQEEECYCYVEEYKLKHLTEDDKKRLYKKDTCSCQGIPLPLQDLSIQKAVETAIDAGYRLIDTAASYKTESQVGNAIQNKIKEGVVQRDDLFIVSKLWNDSHPKGAVIPTLKESLKKLGLDYLDLYLIHWPIGVRADGTFDDTDYLETWYAMIEAQARGLTKSIGVSNFNQHQLDRIISLSKMKPAVLEVEALLFIIAMIKELVNIADKYHKTCAQIALRYLIDLGVIPVPNAVTALHLWQNIDVFNFKLTKAEHDVLTKYDKNHRILAVPFWKDSPYYPFS